MIMKVERNLLFETHAGWGMGTSLQFIRLDYKAERIIKKNVHISNFNTQMMVAPFTQTTGKSIMGKGHWIRKCWVSIPGSKKTCSVDIHRFLDFRREVQVSLYAYTHFSETWEQTHSPKKCTQSNKGRKSRTE